MLVSTATPAINSDNCSSADAYTTASDVSSHSQQAVLLIVWNANLSISLAVQGWDVRLFWVCIAVSIDHGGSAINLR